MGKTLSWGRMLGISVFHLRALVTPWLLGLYLPAQRSRLAYQNFCSTTHHHYLLLLGRRRYHFRPRSPSSSTSFTPPWLQTPICPSPYGWKHSTFPVLRHSGPVILSSLLKLAQSFRPSAVSHAPVRERGRERSRYDLAGSWWLVLTFLCNSRT